MGLPLTKRADFGEFFAELFRFIVFLGFYLWLLRNGPAMAIALINSMRQLAEQASGVRGISPSGVVDIGFLIWHRAIESMSLWKPVGSFAGALLSAGILLVLAIVAANMLLLLVSAWLLAYAGVFILGFGGSRWTSDMAVNYFKTLLALGLQIMTMALVIGIGTDLLTMFYSEMTGGTLNFDELATMFVFVIVLAILSNKLPPMVGGLVSGGSIGGSGIGNFGAAAVMGAAMSAANTAAGAARLLGAAAAGTAASAAGGASALMAAYQKAQGSIAGSSGGAGVMDASAFGRGGDGGGGGGSSSSKSQGAGTAGDTPFAQAAGLGGSGGQRSAGGSAAASMTGGGSDSSSGTASSADGSAGGADASGEAGSAGGSGSPSAAASSGGGSASGGTEASGIAASGSGGSGSPTGSDGKAQGRGRLATAGAIAAGTGAALAHGIADVATDKMDALKEAGRKRIAATLGGQVAAAIERSGGDAKGKDGGSDAAIPSTPDPSPTFGGNSLAGADESASTAGAVTSLGSAAGSATPTRGEDTATGGAQRSFTDEQLAEISAFVNKERPPSEA